MGRIMAIDFGLRRIGVAVTDPLKIFAQPLETVDTKNFPDWLKKYMSMESIEQFIVGLPTNLSGDDTHSTESVRQFISWLETNYTSIPVSTIDERFSSHEAQLHINQSVAKKSDRKNKGLVDTIAATIILQTHLQKIS